MCCRYRMPEDDDTELQMIIAVLQRKHEHLNIKTSGDALPTDLLPVIANNRRGERSVFAMRWGYPTAGSCVINARSETAHEKPLFADGVKNRRCLIPAAWYYEWETRGREKIRYAIRPQGKGLTYLAGLYRQADVGEPAQFVVLTREAAQDVAFIHPRMPVILPRVLLGDWLNPASDAQVLLGEAITKLDFGAA